MSSHYPSSSLNKVVAPVERPTSPVPGQIYRQLGVQLWGRGAYEREELEGSRTKYKTLSRVQAGDIVVNKIWARNGSVAVVPSELAGCYVSGEFPTFAPALDKLEPAWFHWYSKTPALWHQCDEKSRGTSGKNRIRPEKFLEIEIPLPVLGEQRRIVSRIEKLAANVEEAKELRRQALLEIRALPIALVSQAIGLHETDGRLGDVLCGKPRNGWSPRCNEEAGLPVLSLSAVTGFDYRPTAFKRTSEPTAPDAHYWLTPGDLLITRSNTPELVGHAAIYDGSPTPCIYPDLMMRLEVNKALADTRFVHRWLMSRPARDYIQTAATGTSPTMKKISQGTVMSIPFPTHLDVSEQRRIVANLDNWQTKTASLKKLQSETSTELDALMPSILSKAFRGEL
jgi:type I restriction enzyme S subunit